MHVTIPHEPFNTLAKNGIVGTRIKRILETLKPEAAYFTEHNGLRGAVLVVEVSEPSKIPFFAEPWFISFEADVEFRIAMTPADLEKSGLDDAAKKWG